MIWEFHKEYTGYDLIEPRNTVICWVKTCIDELIEKKMGFGTQVNQDNFKLAVEMFWDRLEILKADIKQSKESKEAQAAELFEATQLQKTRGFEMDDEPIVSIDSESSNLQNISITLNSSNQKQKRDRAVSTGLSNNTVLLAETFEKSTSVLAKALVACQNSDPILVSTFSLNNDLSDLNQRLTKIETGLEDMKSELGNMKNMLGRIFAAVLGSQINNNITASTNITSWFLNNNIHNLIIQKSTIWLWDFLCLLTNSNCYSFFILHTLIYTDFVPVVIIFFINFRQL